ncbi:hypothetical protein OZX67_09160 [Bifidobacterium sp. ESL0728]|uniref:hypothetical protein n=1 Tax=Bifidobacterium sp. ESL0728 TaxID=2983220 RepID=UPI0023F8A5BB|nr:hypothetical protein [Bifidobacterium sp. ESL0728]WEV58938.1 hypothetical protein OZX67_09160 [Bifidobacterium sp. ESL0728]
MTRRNEFKKQYHFARNRDILSSEHGDFTDIRGNVAGKQRNFAKEKANAGGKQGILSRLGSWKHVLFMVVIFIWVALGSFAVFKALNTETIVTEDPQTVSAIYQQKQADVDKAASPVPAVWLVK